MNEHDIEQNTRRIALRPSDMDLKVGPLYFKHVVDTLVVSGDKIEQPLRYYFRDLMSQNQLRLHDENGRDLPVPVAASCDGIVVNLTVGAAATRAQKCLRAFVDNPWEFELDFRRVLPPCCHPTSPQFSVTYADECVVFEVGRKFGITHVDCVRIPFAKVPTGRWERLKRRDKFGETLLFPIEIRRKPTLFSGTPIIQVRWLREGPSSPAVSKQQGSGDIREVLERAGNALGNIGDVKELLPVLASAGKALTNVRGSAAVAAGVAALGLSAAAAAWLAKRSSAQEQSGLLPGGGLQDGGSADPNVTYDLSTEKSPKEMEEERIRVGQGAADYQRATQVMDVIGRARDNIISNWKVGG